jgi:5-methylcytosine-specific restriction enzyme A
MMKPCAKTGCPELVTKGRYCARHRQAVEQARGTATARGYSKQWSRYSARRLAQHPFCTMCGRLAEVTDHIVSARQAPARFWDETNHQSLCGACNRRKAIAEEGTFGGAPRTS